MGGLALGAGVAIRLVVRGVLGGGGRGRRSACAAAGVGGAGFGWVGGYGLIEPPRPPPPVILPGAAFASLCLAGASRRASPFRLALPRVGGEVGGGCRRSACAAAGVGGAGFGWVGGYGLIEPPRPPPPVILPGAAFALLRLAGAFAPGFALRARAAAGGWGAGWGRVAPCGLCCRGCGRGECWVGCVVRLVDTAPPTPTRNPPWRGIRFALPCRRVRAGLRRSGSRCRLPVGKVGGPVSVWRGAEKTRHGVEST